VGPLCGSHVGGCGKVVPVIVELLRQVPALSSEEPEAILGLVTKLDEIHALCLVDGKAFLVRMLPLVSGAVLRLFGECLRSGGSWEQCKRELLKEFFPHFVRERVIRDHVVFNFHEEGGAVRDYVDSVCRGKIFGVRGGGRAVSCPCSDEHTPYCFGPFCIFGETPFP